MYCYEIVKAENGEIKIDNATLDYKKDTVSVFIENEGKDFYITIWGS